MATEARQRVLVVDDEPLNVAVLSGLLSQDYEVSTATCGAAALAFAREDPHPDLILLDIVMPGLDGFEVLERLRADVATASIPVMFLTALLDHREEERGLALGAKDFLTKPIQTSILRARVRTQLLAKQGRDWLQDRNAALDAEVARRMADNERVERLTIRALAHLAEMRDNETGNHILRTQNYVGALARQLARLDRHQGELAPENIELLVKSAPLHDIGKVGIPDCILRKPGPLAGEEWTIMKTHAELGAQALERAEADVAAPLPFLRYAKEIAHWHHERWDGSGYPDGLQADAIPLSARLMALADVFDALISERVYKAAFPLDLAREMILQGRGSHFDPQVVDAFEAVFEEFRQIAMQFADSSTAAGVGHH